MPTICCTSSYHGRDDTYKFTLDARHTLVAVSSSTTPAKVSTRIFDAVGATHLSDIQFSLSGELDGTRLRGENAKESPFFHHFLCCLRLHAPHLNIRHVSETYIDDKDGLAKFTVFIGSSINGANWLPHLTLVSIDLRYICNSTQVVGSLQDNSPLWTSSLPLPLISIIDPAVERFLVNLTKRYPLIFGSVINAVHAEDTFCRSISISLTSIIDRSRNPVFQRECRTTLKSILNKQNKFRLSSLRLFFDCFRASLLDFSLREVGCEEVPEIDIALINESMLQVLRPRILSRNHRGFVRALESDNVGPHEHLAQGDIAQAIPPTYHEQCVVPTTLLPQDQDSHGVQYKEHDPLIIPPVDCAQWEDLTELFDSSQTDDIGGLVGSKMYGSHEAPLISITPFIFQSFEPS